MTVTPARPLVEKAHDLYGIPRAFRPNPLSAEEIKTGFYSDSLNGRRASHLRCLKDDLLESADLGFFFKGVLYGNRGVGKSTEINRLMDDPAIKRKFLVMRLDALDQLNPQTFSVVDVLTLLVISLLEGCEAECKRQQLAFHEAAGMMVDLQQQLAPFFPELQNKEQRTAISGGGGEVNLLQAIKLSVRVEGQRKLDVVAQRESLAGLQRYLDRLVTVAREHLPGRELLIIGENFDKEQIPQRLLEDTFVQYSSLIRDLRLHLLFTLPVPFVYSYADQLAFTRANRYPIYDVPVFQENHKKDESGYRAVIDLMEKRADLGKVFHDDAVDLLIRGSGGDLFLLFALINRAGRLARYRSEDDRSSPALVSRQDVRSVAAEQLGIFRNEMGTVPGDDDPTDWEVKRQKLRDIEGKPEASVPDAALYGLLRRRAVLFCNGKGRYAVHPMGVEILREQFHRDPSFQYRGGGLDLDLWLRVPLIG